MEQGTLSSRQPRYARLADILGREIAEGQYPVGSLLPKEAELCERFDVSRATVREALRRITELGMISKVHGVGTRVQSTEPRSNYFVAVRSASETMHYEGETELTVMRIEPFANVPEARSLGLATDAHGRKVMGYRAMQHGDSRPIAYSELYINHPFDKVLDFERLPGVPFHRMITQKLGIEIEGIDQEIRAIALSEYQAEIVDAAPGSPGLLIIRRFFGPGKRLIEATLNVHPAERFTHRMYLRRDN